MAMSSNFCFICRSVQKETVQVACVPCGHTFCHSCIIPRQRTSRTCPRCCQDVGALLCLDNDGILQFRAQNIRMSFNACCTCQRQLLETESAACVPCGHTFCYSCITLRQLTSSTCPACCLEVVSVLYVNSDELPYRNIRVSFNVCCICERQLLETVRAVCVPCGHTFCDSCNTPWPLTTLICPACYLHVASALYLSNDGRLLYRAQRTATPSNFCFICESQWMEKMQVACVPCGHTFCHSCIIPVQRVSWTCPRCHQYVASVLCLNNDWSLPYRAQIMFPNTCFICELQPERVQVACIPCGHTFFSSYVCIHQLTSSACPRCCLEVAAVLRLKDDGILSDRAQNTAEHIRPSLEHPGEYFGYLARSRDRIKAWWQRLNMEQKSITIGAMLVAFMLLLFDFRQADGVFHTFLAPVLRGIGAIFYFPVYLLLYILSYCALVHPELLGPLFYNFLVFVLRLVFELVRGIARFFINGARVRYR